MINNDLVSLISLSASFADVPLKSFGTLTLTYIDNVSIMKSSVCPTLKRGGITGE